MFRRPLVTRILIAAVVVAALGYAFARTLRTVGSAPYVIDASALAPWTVAVGAAGGPGSPLVELRPPPALPLAFFDQVFQRTMESWTAPREPGIPLVLRGEVGAAATGPASPDALVALADRVGLSTARVTPRCMVVQRTQAGREQRSYLVLFDIPAFDRFREELGRALQAADGAPGFDPEALAPALLVAASDARRFDDVIPGGAPASICDAPVETSPPQG